MASSIASTCRRGDAVVCSTAVVSGGWMTMINWKRSAGISSYKSAPTNTAAPGRCRALMEAVSAYYRVMAMVMFTE